MSSQLIEHAGCAWQPCRKSPTDGQGGGSPSHLEYLERIAAYNRLLDKHVVSLDKQKPTRLRKGFWHGRHQVF